MIFIVVCLYIFCFGSSSYGDELSLSGESYILMDEVSGRILMGKSPHKKVAMASTTKIMTALVAIENGDLNTQILIGEESVGIEGSSIYLRVGETLYLRDLLYGLMLRSGNDAAVAIANHIGKDEEDFVKMMNEKAKSIGAYNTSFANPHGLDDPNHYSNAYDLALITREALKHKEFLDIFSAKYYRAHRETDNYFVSKNKTLWEYEGGDGGKTGYTMKSGRCLISTAKRNNMRLIAVSLRAGDWFNDNYKLLDYGFRNFKQYIIYDKNQFISKIRINNGEKEELPLVSENELIYPLKEDELEKVKIKINKLNNIDAPITKDHVFGYVEVYLDGVLIKKDNLISKYSINKKSFLNRLLDKAIPNAN